MANASLSVNPALSELQTHVLTAFGYLYGAAQRGVTSDLFDAYGRLLKATGRTIDQDAPPRMMRNHEKLLPFGLVRDAGTRLLMVEEVVGPLMRYLAYESHWWLADVTMKGWALAEAEFHQKCHDEALIDAAKYDADGEEGEAELCRRGADISLEQSRKFAALALGEGWVK